jgi:hypothetical protein
MSADPTSPLTQSMMPWSVLVFNTQNEIESVRLMAQSAQTLSEIFCFKLLIQLKLVPSHTSLS